MTLKLDTEVVRDGTKIILPNKPQDMSLDTAIDVLKRKRDEEEKAFSVYQQIQCSPLDGLVAFNRALKERYGWSTPVPTPGFFGPNPPMMLGVPVGRNETMQVPYGSFRLTGVNGTLCTSIQFKPRPAFILSGDILFKHKGEVDALVALTHKYLKEQSIYKGKAVKVSFIYNRIAGRKYDPIYDAPSFMELDANLEHNLIMSDKVKNALEIGVFIPIENSEACRENKVPLKRGVLLHGTYGVGKSLSATVTAIKAERNGWTFIYLNSVDDLREGLEFASNYAPAVVFCEDIDRAVEGGRTIAMDEILNILDGVDTKSQEIITIFTSNDVSQINSAILRMGRLDVVIEVTPPDANAAEKLVVLYGKRFLKSDINLKTIGERLEGKIPAFIREVVERSKIAAIGRCGRDIEGQISENDLIAASDAMEVHNSMLTKKPDSVIPHGRTVLMTLDSDEVRLMGRSANALN